MKHYITTYVRNGFLDLTESTNIYSSHEHASAVLSDILKNKLSQNWEIDTINGKELENINSNAISISQGLNPDGNLSIAWAVHTEPVHESDTFVNYIHIPEQSRDYSELDDIDQVVRMQKMTSMSKGDGFIFALIETIKMYPVVSAGIVLFLLWLFFL